MCTSKLLSARLKLKGSLEAVRYVDEPFEYVLSEVVSYSLVPAPTERDHDGGEKRYVYQWAFFDQEPHDIVRALWCLRVCLPESRRRILASDT